MEEGFGNHAGETEVCKRNGHSNLEGWRGEEDWKHDPQGVVWETIGGAPLSLLWQVGGRGHGALKFIIDNRRTRLWHGKMRY